MVQIHAPPPTKKLREFWMLSPGLFLLAGSGGFSFEFLILSFEFRDLKADRSKLQTCAQFNDQLIR
jgi:hypothetical protein